MLRRDCSNVTVEDLRVLLVEGVRRTWPPSLSQSPHIVRHPWSRSGAPPSAVGQLLGQSLHAPREREPNPACGGAITHQAQAKHSHPITLSTASFILTKFCPEQSSTEAHQC